MRLGLTRLSFQHGMAESGGRGAETGRLCAATRLLRARRDFLFAIPAAAGRRLAVARRVSILFVREIWRNPGASCSTT
jgi:hypothetical protein